MMAEAGGAEGQASARGAAGDNTAEHRGEAIAAAPVAVIAEAAGAPKVDNTRFDGLANSLFIEQYKAIRSEILTGVQTSQRIFQFAVTAFVGLNSIAIGFILKSPILSVFDGYVLAVYYGVVVTISMLVFSISWFMEMLRLTRTTVFLRYIEDRVGSFLSAGKAGEPDLFNDRFDGYVIFSERWQHGEMDGNRFDYVSNFPYVYNLAFLVVACVASAATGEAFFINAVLSDGPLSDHFTRPLGLVSLNPLAVLPGLAGGLQAPHVAILLWVNVILVMVILGLVFGSVYSGSRMALNVLRASRAEREAEA